MVLKFAYFVELGIGYLPAKFQCFRLSVPNFTKGLKKHSNDVIMTSFYIVGI